MYELEKILQYNIVNRTIVREREDIFFTPEFM